MNSSTFEDDKKLKKLGFDMEPYKDNYLFFKNFDKINKDEKKLNTYSWHEKAIIVPYIINKECKSLYQLIENTGFNLIEFCVRSIDCLFTNLLNQNKLFALWNLIFFEGASNKKRRADQVMVSAILALIIQARDKLECCKNAEQIEWCLIVEGHFNFDVQAFITCTLDLRDKYLVEKSNDNSSITKKFKSIFNYFVDDPPFQAEMKLAKLRKQYEDIFRPVAIRNVNLLNLFKKSFIADNQRWPKCFKYDYYIEVLNKAFPIVKGNDPYSSQYNSLQANQSVKRSLSHFCKLNLGDAKKIYVQLHTLSLGGQSGKNLKLSVRCGEEANAQELEVLKDGAIILSHWTSHISKAGATQSSPSKQFYYTHSDQSESNPLEDGIQLNFTLENFTNNRAGPICTSKLTLEPYEGEHFYVVKLGMVYLTLSCFLSNSDDEKVKGKIDPQPQNKAVEEKIFQKLYQPKGILAKYKEYQSSNTILNDIKCEGLFSSRLFKLNLLTSEAEEFLKGFFISSDDKITQSLNNLNKLNLFNPIDTNNLFELLIGPI